MLFYYPVFLFNHNLPFNYTGEGAVAGKVQLFFWQTWSISISLLNTSRGVHFKWSFFLPVKAVWTNVRRGNWRHHITIPVSDRADELVWERASNGVLTVRKAFDFYRDGEPVVDWLKKLWQSFVPPNISMFAWRLYHDRRPTETNLSYSGMEVDGRCWLCNNQLVLENQNHMLLHCQYDGVIWSWVQSWLVVDISSFNTVKEVLQRNCKRNRTISISSLSSQLLYALCGNHGKQGTDYCSMREWRNLVLLHWILAIGYKSFKAIVPMEAEVLQ